MQYCPKCKIQIRGNKACCPLCQGKLTKDPQDPAFPALKHRIVTSFSIIKVSTFLFLVLEIIMGTIGYLGKYELNKSLPWVSLVMIGALVAWVDLIVAMYLRNNILKIVTVEVYVAMIIDYVIDVYTGFGGWSVMWMIPATFFGLAFVTVCIGRMTRMRLEDYIFYLATDALLCMLQMIPMAQGRNAFEWPAVICMAIYLILAAGAVIFRFRDLKNASAKYFNV